MWPSIDFSLERKTDNIELRYISPSSSQEKTEVASKFLIGMFNALGFTPNEHYSYPGLILILCINMLNTPLLLFEPNKILSLFEIGLLILAIASCFVASEIYYQYLRGTENEKQFATNNRNR